MKRYLFIVLVFFISFSSFYGQKKDLIATTEDGKKVLLKANGTWEYIKAESKIDSSLSKIKEWKGRGIKKTESFFISTNEWSVVWNTAPQDEYSGNFIIMVYKEGSNIPDVIANVIGKDKDYSIMRGKGKYWLEINATQPWEVFIFELKK